MCEKVTFGIQKMKRGQVWFCNEPVAVTNALRDANCKGINGARPYFIVNVNGTMVNCIPMTTNVTATDTKDTNIIFDDPISGVTSRLVINQIQTKGINEFNEYRYTFDEEAVREIMGRIKDCIFGADTVTKPVSIKKDVEQHEKESIPKAIAPVLPDECKQLEMHIVQYLKMPTNKRKGEAMFRTQREAIIFMNEYHDKPADELAKIFETDKPAVYRMRTKAKEAAYRKEFN